MPNGHDHSPKRFEELEKPLRSIEDLFRSLAADSGGEYEVNYHNHPERRVTVKRGRLVQCIGASVVIAGENFRPGPNDAAYVFWGIAWWDVADGRWSWHKHFAYWPEIPPAQEVRAILPSAWREVQSIRKRDMKFFHNPYKEHERTHA
jgi:hypothetical protein